MKIFVVSDTHSSIEEFIVKMNTMEKPDLIIHLGDYVEDGIKVENETNIKTIIVKGNGDYFNQEYKEEEILEIKDRRIFITHGHKYRVGYGVENLLYRGEELEAEIILFGHTHVPIAIEKSGIMIMNPGSPSIPRGFDRKKTFGVLEVGEKIKMRIIEVE